MFEENRIILETWEGKIEDTRGTKKEIGEEIKE